MLETQKEIKKKNVNCEFEQTRLNAFVLQKSYFQPKNRPFKFAQH